MSNNCKKLKLVLNIKPSTYGISKRTQSECVGHMYVINKTPPHVSVETCSEFHLWMFKFIPTEKYLIEVSLQTQTNSLTLTLCACSKHSFGICILKINFHNSSSVTQKLHPESAINLKSFHKYFNLWIFRWRNKDIYQVTEMAELKSDYIHLVSNTQACTESMERRISSFNNSWNFKFYKMRPSMRIATVKILFANFDY